MSEKSPRGGADTILIQYLLTNCAKGFARGNALNILCLLTLTSIAAASASPSSVLHCGQRLKDLVPATANTSLSVQVQVVVFFNFVFSSQ